MRSELTEKQRRILDFIVECISDQGMPPTLREIAQHFGMRSVRSVQTHLEALERKGAIRRLIGKSRGIEVIGQARRRERGIPVVGQIAAGRPIPAVEDVQEVLNLDVWFGRDERPFALRVQGDSMIEAGILNGDLVIVQPQSMVQPGEIVVAIKENEATVKFFMMKENQPWLVPANARYRSMPLGEGQIVGRVVGVVRRVKHSLHNLQEILHRRETDGQARSAQ
ncbi:transcriptional repressor LexA [Candidatus Acetothermia bacterium]|jgi:repressor LexA|nr:transcriptional repressor LexA [Candidatus Acetothermia bacterium]MCI2431918.1 transcriptional repressor LexA [Candidatus Acetothermia bacterium]MCI2437349.1 transcriptional repressor LexA [Candidatus Acetothermia bacterium]